MTIECVTLFLVIVTGLLVVVTALLVNSTNKAKTSAENQSKSNIETNVMNIYFNAEWRFASTVQEFFRLDRDNNYSLTEAECEIIRISYDSLLNATEYLCIKFSNNEIPQKSFKNYFEKIIIDTYENSFYKKDKGLREDTNFWEYNFLESNNEYPYIIKVYYSFKEGNI